MRFQNRMILSFAIVLMAAVAVSAQDGYRPLEPTQTDMAISLQVNSQLYHFTGKGVCRHAPVASIYNVAAEMWSVRQNDRRQSFSLTLWHPRSQPGDLFSLSVAIGGKPYFVDTVQVVKESSVQGSGRVTLTKSGAGATFTINAKTSNGAAINGTVTCSGFTAPIAEGG